MAGARGAPPSSVFPSPPALCESRAPGTEMTKGGACRVAGSEQSRARRQQRRPGGRAEPRGRGTEHMAPAEAAPRSAPAPEPSKIHPVRCGQHLVGWESPASRPPHRDRRAEHRQDGPGERRASLPAISAHHGQKDEPQNHVFNNRTQQIGTIKTNIHSNTLLKYSQQFSPKDSKLVSFQVCIKVTI